jgi:hypothetical protein
VNDSTVTSPQSEQAGMPSVMKFIASREVGPTISVSGYKLTGMRAKVSFQTGDIYTELFWECIEKTL